MKTTMIDANDYRICECAEPDWKNPCVQCRKCNGWAESAANDLLYLAYPYLMDMQVAAAMTDNQHGTDASGDDYDRIRGLCQQVAAHLEASNVRKD